MQKKTITFLPLSMCFFTCSRVANVCHLCMKPTTFHFDGPGSENSSEIKINKNQNTLQKIFSIKAFYISCLRNHDFSDCRCKDIFNKNPKTYLHRGSQSLIFLWISLFIVYLLIYLPALHSFSRDAYSDNVLASCWAIIHIF